MTIVGNHARAGALIALLGAVAPGCGSELANTVKGQLDRVSQTMELCRDILPEPGDELPASASSARGDALLDPRYLGRRLRAYLGDLESLTAEPMATAFKAHEERLLEAMDLGKPWTLERIARCSTACLEEAKTKGPRAAAAVDLLIAAKDFRGALGEMASSASDLARLLTAGDPGDGTLLYLQGNIIKNLEKARELRKTALRLRAYYQVLEERASALRDAFARGDAAAPAKQSLRRLTGRARAHHQWSSASMPLLDGLVMGQPSRMFSALAVREVGGLSRLALQAVKAAIRNLDRQLQRVDEQAYGAITLFSVATGPDVDPIVQAAFCDASRQIAGVLRHMSVEPRALAVEACASLTSSSGRDDELLLSGKYHAFLRGLVQGTTLNTCGEKAAPARSPSDEWANFQRSATYASVTSEWTARLAYEITHGNGPPQPTGLAAARLAHAEALLRAPLAPDDLKIKDGTPTDEALALAVADIAIHVQARHEISVTGPDAAGFDRAVQRLIDENLRQAELQAQLLETLRRREALYDQGRQVATLCSVISQDRLLQRKGIIEVLCSDRRGAELQYNVVSIAFDANYELGQWAVHNVVTKRKEAKESIDNANKMIVDLKASKDPDRHGKIKEQNDVIKKSKMIQSQTGKLETIHGGLQLLATHMREVADKAGLRVRVSGNASSVPFTCEQLAKQLTSGHLDVNECVDKSSATPCYGFSGPEKKPAEIFLRIDDKRGKACEDNDANPLLSALRAWSAHNVLQGSLKGSGLYVDMPEDIFKGGDGKSEMQRISVALYPKE